MEIIQQLPKLTPAERRAIQDKLRDLALEDDEVRLCDAAAVAGAQLLDQMEDEDARRPQG